MNHKTKNILLIIAAIIIVGCMLYLPGLNNLGLYRNAWNYFYDLTLRGTDALIKSFSPDRPAAGYLITVLYRLFGENINAYLIWSLCCRVLSSIFFALSLLIIWPRTPKMAGLAGILAVTYSGFLHQADTVTFLPHQFAMLCFMISLWLTALACEPGQKSWNVLFTFLSMLFAFVSMMLMKYYIGMEIYRLGLIYLMNREQAGKGKPSSFFRCIISYIPYLIPLAGFAAVHLFFFNGGRPWTEAGRAILDPFLAAPLQESGALGVRLVKNVWKLFAGVWTLPAHKLLNGLNMPEFVKALVPALIIFAAGQLFLFLMHRRRTEESVLDASNEAAQWLWYGLICGTCAILPLLIMGKNIEFTSNLDHYSWPGMIGTVLFLTGLLGSLRDRSLRNLLTMAAVLLSVFVQWQNQSEYIRTWKNEQDFWQQLIWRAPSLEEGTVITTGAPGLAEQDFELSAPASMIYYPTDMDQVPVSAEILTDDTIRSIRLGDAASQEKDYRHLLALSKPGQNSCLRVIDGTNPIYSLSERSRIREIGEYSRPEQILTTQVDPVSYPFFLKGEQEHGWCYYFEKMELALQMEDPETAAGLADEAAAKGLSAADPVELLPMAEAYVQTGRMEDALPIAEELHKDPYLSYSALNYFSAKADPSLYADVIAVLKGKKSAADTGTDVAGTEIETVSEVSDAAEEAEPENHDNVKMPDEIVPTAETIASPLPPAEEKPESAESDKTDGIEETPVSGLTPAPETENPDDAEKISDRKGNMLPDEEQTSTPTPEVVGDFI